MASKKFNKRTVFYRRKRQQKTNYKKRLNLLKSGITRLVVRVHNNMIVAQLVDYDVKGDKVLVTVNSTDLKKMGWNYATANLPACYLTGMLLAKKANEKKINPEKVILDLGIKNYAIKTRPYAVVKGALDNGIKVIVGEDAFPAQERIEGKHIADFATKSKEINKFQFNKTKDIEKITDAFNKLSGELKNG